MVDGDRLSETEAAILASCSASADESLYLAAPPVNPLPFGRVKGALEAHQERVAVNRLIGLGLLEFVEVVDAGFFAVKFRRTPAGRAAVDEWLLRP